MTYQEAFKKIEEKFKNVKTTGFEDFFAIQVNITDEDCGGIFYIEYKNGKLNVEPYDYIDRTTVVTAPRAELMKVFGGTALIQNAIEKGKIEANGNIDCLIKLADALKAANKKPAVKKVTKKAVEKKTEPAKKTESAKKAEPAEKVEQIKLEIPEVKKTTKKAVKKTK